MSQKIKRIALTAFIIFSVIMLTTVLVLNWHSSQQSQEILAESIKSQLISISSAARELIDPVKFDSYNDANVAELPEYQATLAELRALGTSVGADYIYALKEMQGKYYFVFDTDVEDPEIFIDYEISPVHMAAFTGHDSADIMNVVDEFGSFHTGAVPIRATDGKVIGIISTDIEDTLVARGRHNVVINTIVLIVSVLITVLGMGGMLLFTFHKLSTLQESLVRMAKYDKLTNLPNRQYLMEQLQEMTAGKEPAPFALLFIDLDNFKKVNDNAGHDAGDSLLVQIASFLESVQSQSTVFRPIAGKLNVAARIGGDEFIMLAPGIDNEEKAAAFAGELFKAFDDEKIKHYAEKYEVGFSIGVALYPKNSEDFNVIIKYADIAMYHAKRSGKNQCMVYHEDMTQKEGK